MAFCVMFGILSYIKSETISFYNQLLAHVESNQTAQTFEGIQLQVGKAKMIIPLKQMMQYIYIYIIQLILAVISIFLQNSYDSNGIHRILGLRTPFIRRHNSSRIVC